MPFIEKGDGCILQLCLGSIGGSEAIRFMDILVGNNSFANQYFSLSPAGKVSCPSESKRWDSRSERSN